MTDTSSLVRSFVSPEIQLRAAESGLVPVDVVIRTTRFEATARTMRRSPERHVRGYPANAGNGAEIRVFDLGGGMDSGCGIPVRVTDDGKVSSDPVVEAAMTNASIVQRYYAEEFGRDSITGDNMPLEICVHFGDRINNALWDGAQFHFGDGDGVLFRPFATSLEVVAHELSHAVIDTTSGLRYDGESGALNESFADVMAAMAVQRHLALDVYDANWLIGTDVLMPGIGIDGVRSFKGAPAYRNHARLQSDVQPKHYRDFVRDLADNGSVHANSGIPNHAFYLAASRLGGRAWERAGRIWFEAFTRLAATADFQAAAEKTVWVANDINDAEAVEAFREAWDAVGLKVED